MTEKLNTAGVTAAVNSNFPGLEDFQNIEGGGPWSGQEEVGRSGIVTCSGEGQLVRWPTEARAQRGKKTVPDMQPGAGPSRAPHHRTAESQQRAPAQCIKGHGQILLFGELCNSDQCCLTLQNILGQTPGSRCSRASPTRARRGRSSSSNCASRRPKRSCDSSCRSADCPAAKRQRQRHTRKRPRDRCKTADPCERVTAQAPAGTRGSETAAEPASGCWDPWRPPGAQLLLVLCRASALRSNRPRLKRLLQQVQARDCQPPAALVGIVLQPRPEEEAEARGRLETLLCSAFAPPRPPVEVRTAAFGRSRCE